METQLATDSTLSGLDLLFKEQLVTDQNIILKISGVFSTVSGLREYAGSLHKFITLGSNSPSTRTVRNHYKKEKGLLKLGAGAFYGWAQAFLILLKLLPGCCRFLIRSLLRHDGKQTCPVKRMRRESSTQRLKVQRGIASSKKQSIATPQGHSEVVACHYWEYSRMHLQYGMPYQHPMLIFVSTARDAGVVQREVRNLRFLFDRSNMRQEEIKLQLSARKQFEVKSPDCLLKAVALADYDTKTQEVGPDYSPFS